MLNELALKLAGIIYRDREEIREFKIGQFLGVIESADNLGTLEVAKALKEKRAANLRSLATLRILIHNDAPDSMFEEVKEE